MTSPTKPMLPAVLTAQPVSSELSTNTMLRTRRTSSPTVATLFCVALGRPLNVLARGETIAATVGLDVRRVRSIVFVLSSLLTGCAVSTAGSIGFVGLVTPHLVRLALGNDQRIVLAGSALLGGLVLMTADLASRLLLAPRKLPVGALTALVGVPIFLLLMLRQRH